MAKKSAKAENKKTIPHSFFIPDGVTSLAHRDEKNEDDMDYLVDDSNQQLIDSTLNVEVVSQTLRMSNDGALTVLVDVVLEVDDATGIDNYEVRVAVAS